MSLRLLDNHQKHSKKSFLARSLTNKDHATIELNRTLTQTQHHI